VTYIVFGRMPNGEPALHLCDTPEKMRATAEEMARSTRTRVDVFAMVSSVDPVLEVTSLNWSATVPTPTLEQGGSNGLPTATITGVTQQSPPQQEQQQQPPQQQQQPDYSAMGSFGATDDHPFDLGNFRAQEQPLELDTRAEDEERQAQQ
jgi:hypothetical protein